MVSGDHQGALSSLSVGIKVALSIEGLHHNPKVAAESRGGAMASKEGDVMFSAQFLLLLLL